MSGGLDDLLVAAERSLSNHANTEGLVHVVTALHQLEGEVDELLAPLGQLAEALDIATTRGFAPPPSATTDLPARLTDAAEGIRDQYKIAPGLPNTLAAVRRFDKQLAASVNEAWGSHVRARIPNAEGLGALAATLTGLGASAEHVQRLRQAVTATQRLPRRLPDASGVAELDSIAADLPDALRTLMGDNDEVRRFADQLARGGAHVDALTPSVREWMREHGFDQSFKIVAGQPAGA